MLHLVMNVVADEISGGAALGDVVIADEMVEDAVLGDDVVADGTERLHLVML
jgi:hypothetical protein